MKAKGTSFSTRIRRPIKSTKTSISKSTINNVDIAAAHIMILVRSGWIDIVNGRLRFAGNGGVDWPSRADKATTNSFNFNFYAPDVRPSHSDSRYYGIPLRCLSTV